MAGGEIDHPEVGSMSDSVPVPDAALLAYLQDQAIENAEDKNLEFHYDPQRVVAALRGLVLEDEHIWLFHLYQLLFDLKGVHSATLEVLPGGRVNWILDGLNSEDQQSLSVDGVENHWNQPLGSSPAARMARVLWECPDRVEYQTGTHPELRMVVEGGVASIKQSDFLKLPERSLRLEFSDKLLSRRDVSQRSTLTARFNILRNVSCLHPRPTLFRGALLHPPEWPEVATHKSDDDLMRWDWESVSANSSKTGFSWDVSPWGQRLAEPDEEESQLIFHPVEERRASGYRPIFGSYPSSLDSKWTLEDASAQKIILTVERVFGVSWALTSNHPARIVPMIRGVPGASIYLPEAPAGLFCLAEAGHLQRDISGRTLVQGRDYEEWLDGAVEWMKVQVSLYAPLLPRTGEFWLRRVNSPSHLGENHRGLGHKIFVSALAKVYASKPLQKAVARRQGALLRWSDSGI